MVANAHKAAKVERELNDFIAHEVRNPLSAAISATSFIASSVSEAQPLATEEARKSVQEDVSIIGASLMFINDLLRNMLEPVASMLYHRCDDFEVQVDCPKNLMVMTDGLRLKQIVLNLGRNAVKFVEKGFLRLRAELVDGMVQLFVEDSGPGIPVEKRDRLFSKFQESLDSLNQGTGIGLCVCRNLIDLMDGNIVLDDIYDSGLEGSPGSRFIIQLNKPAVCMDSIVIDTEPDGIPSKAVKLDLLNLSMRRIAVDDSLLRELPEKLSVLFVDDDMLLRKLFARSIRKLMPSWELHEASNGETALRLVDGNTFDIIFMDQYMASVDKQLLGTETVRALRAKGVTSRICGLSANDMEKPFLRNGANGFLIKPFPCTKDPLTRDLLRILYEEPDLVHETCSTISGGSTG
jgi:CheY-like chemotaxis protein